jgi:transglutaminase-like putative cysteine protease
VHYSVRHQTTYRYPEGVSSSRHLVHLMPRETARQLRRTFELTVSPAPARHETLTDVFGNATDLLAFDEPYAQLQLVSESDVEVEPAPIYDATTSEPWERVRAQLETPNEELRAVVQFLFDTSLVNASPQIVEYARASFPAGRPLLAAALDLNARIHADIRYDTTATDAATPVEEVFELRAGVCQDLAHAGIAALRAMGLAARYVSGYRRTLPPPGSERIVGADQSHAWFSVWAPPFGWVDLDPTSNVVVGDEHVTVAWGRDYRDVAPVHGVVTGGREHKLIVGVDVIPR